MKSGTALTILPFLALLPALGACDKQTISERAENDEIAVVNHDDPAMTRAFEKARATLDDFFREAASPRDGTTQYSVKVGITDGANTEYFWVVDFERNGDTMTGILNNEPDLVKTHKIGDRISFTREQVVDWTYLEPAARRMHGNFTACAMLVHEDPSEAEEFRKQYGLQCD
jgi:uncharacterized protein YegJ (DUF2314 family)